jgi:hypothetical protein
VEFFLLRRTLARRIGPIELPRLFLPRLWSSAAIAAAAAYGLKIVLAPIPPITLGGLALPPPILLGGLTLGPYCLVYLGLTLAFGIPEAQGLLRRVGIKTGRATL